MEIRINKIDAVRALYGRSSYHQADGNGNVKWKDSHETTAEETTAINAKVVELQAEYDAQEYARNRATEYPAIAEQLDEIYHNGIDSWKAVIKVTKDKYPKG
jgi:predicted lipoprotein